MTAPVQAQPAEVTRFRTRLLVAMMLVVSAVAALGLWFAQRNVAANVRLDWQRNVLDPNALPCLRTFFVKNLVGHQHLVSLSRLSLPRRRTTRPICCIRTHVTNWPMCWGGAMARTPRRRRTPCTRDSTGFSTAGAR